jgi:hypothetical protein
MPAEGQQGQSSQPDTTRDANSHDSTGEAEPLTVSDQVIRDILEPLRLGMETQNLQMVMSVFDKKEFSGYSDLEDELRAFFQQFAEVRFRYEILQVTAEKSRGSVTADVEMDPLPYQTTLVPVRRSVQMRLQIALQGKSWKVTGLTPSDFFNVDFNAAGAR